MTARTIVITGGSDGIGAAAAHQLVGSGDEVIVVGRNEQKTRAVAGPLMADWFLVDYSDLAQVHRLADQLLERCPRIDVLANNAGGVFGDRKVTGDGHELTFQVNHLAPFLLTHLLLDRLAESSASVVQTASLAHWGARLDLDDLDVAHDYSPSRAYGNAKLENILFTTELQRRYGDRGISAVAFHPGAVSTSFGTRGGPIQKAMFSSPLAALVLRSPQAAGADLAWHAHGRPGVDWERGGYYAKRRPARLSSAAKDPQLAVGLWERSAAMVGVGASA